MYERNYANDQEQQLRPGAILGTAREMPMAESMHRLMLIIESLDDAVNDLDQRTHVLRQPGPAPMTAKENRAERSYSSLVGSINEQITHLERLHLSIRQITSELEI
jgi:hypothetical protein